MYEGVTGKLRFEGAKHAMIPEVLVRVHEFEDEDEILEWQLAENLVRKELSALERAEGYARLARLRLKKFPNEKTVVNGLALTLEAQSGTKPATQTVRKYLEINAKIKKEARNVSPRVSKENVGVKHLEQICRLEDGNKQAELLLQTDRQHWTVTKLKTEVDLQLGVAKPKPQPVMTGLNVMCPRCMETYELIHIDKGRHTLKKVAGKLEEAYKKTQMTLYKRTFNLIGFQDCMNEFGFKDEKRIDEWFWRKVSQEEIIMNDDNSFRFREAS